MIRAWLRSVYSRSIDSKLRSSRTGTKELAHYGVHRVDSFGTVARYALMRAANADDSIAGKYANDNGMQRRVGAA